MSPTLVTLGLACLLLPGSQGQGDSSRRSHSQPDFLGSVQRDSDITGSEQHVQLILPVKQALGVKGHKDVKMWQPYPIWKNLKEDLNSEFPSKPKKDHTTTEKPSQTAETTTTFGSEQKNDSISSTVNGFPGIFHSSSPSVEEVVTTPKNVIKDLNEESPTTALSVEEKTNIYQINQEDINNQTEEGGSQEVFKKPGHEEGQVVYSTEFHSDESTSVVHNLISHSDGSISTTHFPSTTGHDNVQHVTQETTNVYYQPSSSSEKSYSPQGQSTEAPTFESTSMHNYHFNHPEHPKVDIQSHSFTEQNGSLTPLHGTATYHPLIPDAQNNIPTNKNILELATGSTHLPYVPTESVHNHPYTPTTTENYPSSPSSNYPDSSTHNNLVPTTVVSIVKSSNSEHSHHSVGYTGHKEYESSSTVSTVVSPEGSTPIPVHHSIENSSGKRVTAHGYQVYEPTEPSMQTVSNIFKEMFSTLRPKPIDLHGESHIMEINIHSTHTTDSAVPKEIPVVVIHPSSTKDESDKPLNPSHDTDRHENIHSTAHDATHSSTEKAEVHEVFQSTIVIKPCERTTKPTVVPEEQTLELDGFVQVPQKEIPIDDSQQKQEIITGLQQNEKISDAHSSEVQQTSQDYLEEIKKLLSEHGDESSIDTQQHEQKLLPNDKLILDEQKVQGYIDSQQELQQRQTDLLLQQTEEEQKKVTFEKLLVEPEKLNIDLNSTESENVQVSEQITLKPVVNIVTEISVQWSNNHTSENVTQASNPKEEAGILSQAGKAITDYLVKPWQLVTSVFSHR